MRADELQIGDFIMYNPNVFIEDEYEPSHKCYPSQIKNGEDIDLACEGCYEPIQLTEEILKKNGFEEDKYKIYTIPDAMYDQIKIDILDQSSISIGNTFDEYGLLNSFTYIAYVHELQHALRLCGLNELANNFKV